MFPEFSRPFLQQGNRLPASMPLPSSCVCKPPLELIPDGSKVLRAVFRGGVTAASSDLKLSGCSALSGSSRRAADVPLDSFAETTQGGASASSNTRLPGCLKLLGSPRRAADVPLASAAASASSDPMLSSCSGLVGSPRSATDVPLVPAAEELASSSDPPVDNKIHPDENFASLPDPPVDRKIHPAEKFAEGVLQSGEPVSKMDVLRIFDLLPDTDMLRGDRTRARDSESSVLSRVHTSSAAWPDFGRLRLTSPLLPSVSSGTSGSLILDIPLGQLLSSEICRQSHMPMLTTRRGQ